LEFLHGKGKLTVPRIQGESRKNPSEGEPKKTAKGEKGNSRRMFHGDRQKSKKSEGERRGKKKFNKKEK